MTPPAGPTGPTRCPPAAAGWHRRAGSGRPWRRSPGTAVASTAPAPRPPNGHRHAGDTPAASPAPGCRPPPPGAGCPPPRSGQSPWRRNRCPGSGWPPGCRRRCSRCRRAGPACRRPWCRTRAARRPAATAHRPRPRSGWPGSGRHRHPRASCRRGCAPRRFPHSAHCPGPGECRRCHAGPANRRPARPTGRRAAH